MRPGDSQERLHALDGLRAVMMLLGLVLHSLCSYTVTDLGNAWPYKDPKTNIAVDAIVLFIHQFRIPVFFVLAGFFAALLYGRHGPLGMLRNRWRRIGIPFVVFLLLVWPLVNSGFQFANSSKAANAALAWDQLAPFLSDLAFYVPRDSIHLWFIYYLILFYLITLVLAFVLKAAPGVSTSAARMFAALLAHPVLRLLVPIAITMLTLLPMDGKLATSTTFTPDPALMVAYLVFFGFGWLLYGERRRLEALFTSPGTKVVVATLLFGAVALYLKSPERELALGSFANVLSAAMGAAVAWLMFYGTTGLFLRYLQRPSALLRWVVDASYWVYLVHLPVAIWVPALLVHIDLPVAAKALVTLFCTINLSFATYWLFVRSSVVGTLLNGRRQRRGFEVVGA